LQHVILESEHHGLKPHLPLGKLCTFPV